ncbi:Oidioi.mRNA.OKI2018_I69.chr1.g687.t1.cds [Oikopleura dioica]|uniref:Oidioi.mRNA.OKI2018_I69.chr1.g687.t1.cds n=1 Tax=Oikopleura dioica TaxID=34765 RepID=A0ABN7SPG9_OIKDI|nr:Oidioi.mRNA.OKI2018_I69.chr1.g687.t1.cds [Oikopleura dioica]
MANKKKRKEKKCNEKTQFQCEDSHGSYCITRDWVCDRVPDCENGSDEVDCGFPDSPAPLFQDEEKSNENHVCPKHYICISGQCVIEGGLYDIPDSRDATLTCLEMKHHHDPRNGYGKMEKLADSTTLSQTECSKILNILIVASSVVFGSFFFILFLILFKKLCSKQSSEKPNFSEGKKVHS